MQSNQQTITDFYSAFAQLDPEAMAVCYASAVAFDDEVFSLRGKREVMGMWHMLCEAVKAKGREEWKLEFRDVHAEGDTGQAHWDAHYRFSATGRVVDNSIDARFKFDPAGLITQHRDTFDFWRWSRQALGGTGVLLGWTPLLRDGVRKKADANLRRFLGPGQ